MHDDINLKKTLIKDLLFEFLSEKRRSRRWSIFFKLLFILLFIFFSVFLFFQNDFKNSDHVAIVEIDGLISDRGPANAKNIISFLDDAFYNRHSKAIIVKINSPGGSPVQSNVIYSYIKKLRSYNSKPIYSVIEDVGASGGYLIAVAGEKIYCDPFSIVGSIGVLVSSFGFVDAINKLGIERRVYKSGRHKVILDPFLEKSIEDVEILQRNLSVIHDIFIDIVKQNRYNGINIPECEDVFSGKFWVGSDALRLGLVDGFYNIYNLSSEVLKIDNLVYYNNFGIIGLIGKKF